MSVQSIRHVIVTQMQYNMLQDTSNQCNNLLDFAQLNEQAGTQPIAQWIYLNELYDHNDFCISTGNNSVLQESLNIFQNTHPEAYLDVKKRLAGLQFKKETFRAFLGFDPDAQLDFIPVKIIHDVYGLVPVPAQSFATKTQQQDYYRQCMGVYIKGGVDLPTLSSLPYFYAYLKTFCKNGV